MRAKALQTLKDKEKLIAKLFNDTIVALNDLSDDITQDGTDAYMVKDFDQSRRIEESVTALINFVQEVTVLSTRWKNGVFSIAPTVSMPQRQLVTNVKHESKRTRTRLRVTFTKDNKVFNKSSAIDTFVDTLLAFKLDEVVRLNMKTGYYLLVSKLKSEQNNRLSKKSGDWYINYPNTTQGKRDCLISISKKLGIAIKVDII